MIRHLFTAGLRDLGANWLQSAIALAGLALGLAAAIIAGLVIRNQLSFDSFLPLHDRLYMVGLQVKASGQPVKAVAATPHDEAAKLAGNFPEIEAIARVAFDDHRFRHGAIKGAESGLSADPNIFDLLRLPVLYGDLNTALARPDGIVIPLSIARKYFGGDNVVGQSLVLDETYAMRVSAVVADLPLNGTNLSTAIFISGKSPWSQLNKVDHDPPNGLHKFTVETETYLRLAPGASLAAMQARVDALNNMLLPRPSGMTAKEEIIRVTAFHTMPGYMPGVRERLAAFSAVALVILALAAINFVNLLTARAVRRGREVSIRKVIGASRAALMAQFLGEAMAQALIALVLALALVEWTLPAINATLDTGAALSFGLYGSGILALLAGTLLLGLAAGFYPALILSGFHPSQVLRGAPPGRASLVRRGLVILQFALLAVLVIGDGVLLAQYRFAMTRTLGHADRLLLVSVPDCKSKLGDEIAAMPGVEKTACTDISFVVDANWVLLIKRPNGQSAALNDVTIAPGLLAMMDQRVIAGRDLLPEDWAAGRKAGDAPINVLVNQASLPVLDISSPAAAIGKTIRADDFPVPAVIVGVVPNFSAYALEQPVAPTAYSYRPPNRLSPMLTVLLASRDNKLVLDLIDREWDQSNYRAPFQRMFLDDWLAGQHIALLRQGQAFAVCAGIALLLGALGLFGLSVAEAQRRIKEIGVRKAMGADNAHVLALLLWQFAQPVLWANLIAWPLAYGLMALWLSGFAFHVALPLWLFPAAGLGTLGIALLTVAGQSWLVARQKPVLALRYE